MKVFNKNGVKAFGKVGEKFDPELHDCLFQMPTDDMEPDHIAQLIKGGYMLKDRVLRPAQVGTSKKP
jgi:molecular chaperone GrpE